MALAVCPGLISMNDEKIQNPDAAALRKFGLVLAGMLVLIFGVFFPWWLQRTPTFYWPWIAGLLVSVWSLLAPASLAVIYRPWMKFGELANRITTPLILAILYYLVVTPTGVLLRRFGNSHAALKPDDRLDSYRLESEKRGPDSMEKPF